MKSNAQKDDKELDKWLEDEIRSFKKTGQRMRKGKKVWKWKEANIVLILLIF